MTHTYAFTVKEIEIFEQCISQARLWAAMRDEKLGEKTDMREIESLHSKLDTILLEIA